MSEQQVAHSLSWVDGRYSSTYGSAGGVSLFTISYSVNKQDIAAGTPYTLQCALPGYTSKHWKVVSVEAGKEKAQRLLAAWADRVLGITLSLPESP